MKRFMFVLVATMTLMFIAGPIYADPPAFVPPREGQTFAVIFDCRFPYEPIGETKAWCDEWAEAQPGSVGPGILTFCGGKPATPVRVIAPNGYCDWLCPGADEIRVNCAVMIE